MEWIKIEEIRDDFDLYYARYKKAAMKRVEELMEDILKNGLKTPLDIHKIGDNFYEVVEGIHRFRALKNLGWKKIPCNIVNYGPHASPFPRDRYGYKHEPHQEPNPPKGDKILEGKDVHY
jgi:hypothetical protein